MASNSKHFAIVGLGTFGSAVATELVEFGNHVLGIDVDEASVSALSDTLSEAVIADARDERALREAGIGEDYDAVVVAIAEDLESSILAVMAVQQLGVKRICAKASSPTHARILETLGAHQVMLPEQEFGQHIAHELHNPAVCAYARLSDHLYLAQIRIGEQHAGDTLKSMKVDSDFNLQCLGRISDGKRSDWDGEQALSKGDSLLLMGSRDDIHDFVDDL